jgi:hypothetical protein
VPNQPASYNNVSPFYGTDDRILFTSDRPHNGAGAPLSAARRIREHADRHRHLEPESRDGNLRC